MIPLSPDNDVILRRHWEGDSYWLDVVQAPPRAEFSETLLTGWDRSYAFPEIEVDKIEVGGTVKIRGRNRTVVYRLAECLAGGLVWRGEWPD